MSQALGEDAEHIHRLCQHDIDSAVEVQLLKIGFVPLLWKDDGGFYYDACSVHCLVVFRYFVSLLLKDYYQVRLMSQ